MALIWSAAAPPGGPGGGAGAAGRGRAERGGGLVYAICHPAPAWHGSPWSGGVLKGGEGLVGLERWGSGWRWVVVGGDTV